MRELVVLRALGLGDFLAGLPALRSLRDAFAGHRLRLVAPAAIEPLALLGGAVDEVIPLPPPEQPDVAVNLHGKGPQSHRLLLALPPLRSLIAFAHHAVPETAGMPRWREREHEVERWCRLLRESGIPADPARLDLPRPSDAGIPGATIVHPGAASRARRWPPERYAAVARGELRRGRRVVVTGGPGEGELVNTVVRLAPGAEPAEPGSLLRLAALVAGAGRVVCGDTGMAHLATAYGTPSVLLFGPTPPSLWGPPPRPQHRVLWKGRVGDANGSQADAGLLEIEVEEVLAAL